MAKFDYSDIPAGYYDQIFSRRAGMQSKWHHLKFAIFAPQLVGRLRHLDIGCGPGTFLGLLPDDRSSIGVDIAEEQIAYATARYGTKTKTFQRIAGMPYPFPDASFDVVTIIEVLEHLTAEECMAVMQEAHRLLAPGGVVLVSTPNYSSLWPVIEHFVNTVADVSYEEQHITRFTPHTLMDLFRAAKFEKRECRAYQGFSFAGALIHWRLPNLLAAVENRFLFSRYGLLLFAIGTKT